MSMISRSKILLGLLAFIPVLLVFGLFVGWHSESLDIDLSSHAEYVKQLFNKPKNTTEIAVPQNIAPDAVRIYIGIVTAWWKFGERMLLRETYQHFNVSSNDTVSIRFVLGLPPKEDPGILHFLHWEQERFEDLQILNMSENMNDGKSYRYFADLARSFPTEDPLERPWDYAMKADDDTLLNLPQLLARLRPLPRNDLYMGRGSGEWHMGAGYTLSWDLVLWLKDNKMDQYMNWNEDQAIGAMLREGQKGKNFVDLGNQVMDEPSNKESGWYREYGDDVILVHRLKNLHLFGAAIDFFLGKHREKSG